MLIQETTDYERGGTQKDVYGADEVIDVPCPYCASRDAELVYTEHGAIGIRQCRGCSLIYTSPRFKSPESIYWGDGQKYLDEARLIFEGKAAHHRDVNYAEELDLIERYKPSGRFLDVGCNMGMLMRLAAKRRWSVVGVEPSPPMAEIARGKLGLTVHNCLLDEVPPSESHTFDVVAFSDVFEHISDPLGFLREAARLLRDDGVLYVKVPNARWSLFKQRALALLGRRPKQGVWDAYEHVVHYTDETLRKMLERGGFEVLEIAIARPVQIPAWHHHVGKYYLYPSPWHLDPTRHLGRTACYWLSLAERVARGGRVGDLAPSLVAVARVGG